MIRGLGDMTYEKRLKERRIIQSGEEKTRECNDSLQIPEG